MEGGELHMNAGALQSQKEDLDPLELELTGGYEPADVGAGTQTQVLCAQLNSSAHSLNCESPLSPLLGSFESLGSLGWTKLSDLTI